jgi:hypothetical protein
MMCVPEQILVLRGSSGGADRAPDIFSGSRNAWLVTFVNPYVDGFATIKSRSEAVSSTVTSRLFKLASVTALPTSALLKPEASADAAACTCPPAAIT